jgi:MFS family permease
VNVDNVQPGTLGPLSGMFRSLAVRNYRLFAAGQLVKLVGVWMLFIAQDWLVLQLSHDSATALGLVTALQFTPVVLLTLYGGKLADRFDKRKLLIGSNAVFAALALALGVLVTSGAARLWHVFAFAAALGVITAIETPVRQAFWSELVGPDLLPNALSLGSATFNGARVVGPAVAGVAIASLGTGWVFVITAMMALGQVVSSIRIRPGELYRGEPTAVPARDARIIDGLRYVWHRVDIVTVMVLVLIIGAFGFNFQLTLALLAKTVFHTGPRSFGLLTTSLAIGALGGALAGAVRRSRPSVYVVLTAAIAFSALETGVGFAPGLWSAALLLVPTGFFMIYFLQAANQRVQLGVDPEFRGRVMALYVLVFFGTTPVGAPLIGWISHALGPRAGIWVGGFACLLAALIVAAVQVRRVHAQVRVHLRPSPHVHVRERAHDATPAPEERLSGLRPVVR